MISPWALQVELYALRGKKNDMHFKIQFAHSLKCVISKNISTKTHFWCARLSYFCSAWSILIAINFAQAADHPLCEDLAKFSCAPGLYDDGTGTARSDSSAWDPDERRTLEADRNQIQDDFAKIIDDPEQAYFKKLATSALGLTHSPDCESQQTNSAKRCKDNLIAGLFDAAAKKLVPGEFSSTSFDNENGDIGEYYQLLNNTTFTDLTDKIKKRLTDEPFFEAQAKEVKSTFQDIKKHIIDRIVSLPIEDSLKSPMIDKVKNIKFEGDDCFFQGLNQNFAVNALYMPAMNSVRYCRGLKLKSQSAFSIAFLLAHEIGHSIDPCSISRGPSSQAFNYKDLNDAKKMDAQYPIEGLVECLRHEKSIGSIDKDSVSETRNSKGDKNSSVKFCRGRDQIGESVSDWLAAEVLPKYIASKFPNLTEAQRRVGYSNALRPICATVGDQVRGSPASLTHPPTRNRVNSIILANKEIRAQMGCKEPHSKYIHCDASKPGGIKTLLNSTSQGAGAVGGPTSNSPLPIAPNEMNGVTK
jgi:hypothetical protein